MKALAVRPGASGSLHLREIDEPTLADVDGPAGVLVDLIRVGVDGTDAEIVSGGYGAAPPGDDFLVIGHENLGRVAEVGDRVPDGIRPGGLVVATVRRPGGSVYDRIGRQDLTTDDVYLERGINLRHGFLTERYAEDARFLVPVPEALEPVAVLAEPMSIGEKGIHQAFEIQRRLRVWEPRRALVLGAGSIGLLTGLALRLRGLRLTCLSRRRAPYLNSELVEELGGAYLCSEDVTPEQASRLHGPFDLILDATGFSPLAFQAAEVLGKNGVLVLASLTGGDRRADIPADAINQGFVLGNKVMVGTVNASRDDFVRGIDDMVRAQTLYPGWLGRVLTTPIDGLDRYERMLEALTGDGDAIKVHVEISRAASVTRS